MSYSTKHNAVAADRGTAADRRAYHRFSLSTGQLVADVGAEGQCVTSLPVHDISRGGVRLGVTAGADWNGVSHCVVRFLDETRRVRPAAIRGKIRRMGDDQGDGFVAIEFTEPLDELTLSS
jgi:hypothetical protein